METKVCFGTEAGWFVDEIDLTNVNWKSSNNNIATVDNNGKVIGIAEGTTYITAQYNNERTSEYKINITPYSKQNNSILFILSFIVILLICIAISIIIYKKKNK